MPPSDRTILDLENAWPYLSSKFDDLIALIERASALLQDELGTVLAKESDYDFVLAVIQWSDDVGACYCAALEWRRDLQSRAVPANLQRFFEMVSKGSDCLVSAIDRVYELTWFELESFLALPPDQQVSQTLRIRVVLDDPFPKGTRSEFHRLQRDLDSGDA